MAFILSIVCLVLFFKLLGLIFKLCGKLLGTIFGIVGYIILGCFLIVGLGLAIAFVPILLIAGFLIFFGAFAAAF